LGLAAFDLASFLNSSALPQNTVLSTLKKKKAKPHSQLRLRHFDTTVSETMAILVDMSEQARARQQ